MLRAARLNRTKLTDAKLDRAILDQAWLLEADLSRASLRGANSFAAQMHLKVRGSSVFEALNFHIYAVTDLASITGTGG